MADFHGPFMSPRLLLWREDNIWAEEPDWHFGPPVQQIIAREFCGPTGGRGQLRTVGPRLLRNAQVFALLATIPAENISYRDRAGLKEVLTYLAEGGDLHAEWQP